ncbi:DUF1345 domain-containing protein [Pseudonocardia sp. T1-2H]|uniref:DUF1345 domain-containing protein n=1 Tax=Pseudonocardia sp. T1-2H TaxID=3128899 RepID=UPI0031014C2A
MSTTRTRRAGGRRIISVWRGLSSLAAGIVASLVAVLLGATEIAPLVGWTSGVGILLARVWLASWHQGQLGTEELAEEESRTRSTDTWVLVAAVASLGVITDALVRSSDSQGGTSVALVVLGVVSVVLSWAMTNTVFALKYARLYYRDEDGGIDFLQEEEPTYADFAYMAFAIGMTYGITDTVVTDTRIRKTVLGHALLAYAFGTGILAIAINLVANIGEGPR